MRDSHAHLARFLGGPLAPWLAAVAGGLLPLAFAPLQWAWLALPCLGLLFAIAAAAPRRRALWAGYLFGLGYYGVGISWVYISIGRYGDSGPVLAVIFTALFVAAMALFCWLAIRLARWLRPEGDFLGLAVAFPAAWVLVEWLRTWFLTGFPWLLIGYSQTDTPLAGLAPVFGVLGISSVLAALAGLLAWLLLRPSRLSLAVTVGALVTALGLGQLSRAHEWSAPAGEPMRVALLQGNVEQDKKWSADWTQRTLERYRELTARHWGADLIVWPEAAIPTWYHNVAGTYLTELEREGRRHGTEFLIGIPVFDPGSYQAYNSVVSVGRQYSAYHKHHLVPFGEYVPLRGVFGKALDILGAPMSDFDAGGRPEPLSVAGRPMGVSVCYEAVFGPEIAATLPEAQLLVNVSNDAWFGDSLAPHQHLQMARMRAIETARPLLRATNTGITAVADADGRIIARAPQFEITSLAATITPRSGATPYVRWLDWPVLGLLAAAFALLVFRRYST